MQEEGELFMNKPQKVLLAMISFILLAFSGASNAKAAAVDDAVEIFKECHVYSWDMESIKDNHIIVKWEYRNNYTTDYDNGNYENPFIDIEGFEIQVCADKNYPIDKVITYKTTNYVENAESAKYTVDYVERGGKWYFNYSQTEVQFKVRWRKRSFFGLFS